MNINRVKNDSQYTVYFTQHTMGAWALNKNIVIHFNHAGGILTWLWLEDVISQAGVKLTAGSEPFPTQ